MERRLITKITIRGPGDPASSPAPSSSISASHRHGLQTLLSRGFLHHLGTARLRDRGCACVDRAQTDDRLAQPRGPRAVVSHGQLWRARRFDRCLPDAVEFTVPRAARRSTEHPLLSSTQRACRLRSSRHGRPLPVHVHDANDHRPGPRSRSPTSASRRRSTRLCAPRQVRHDRARGKGLAQFRGPGRWGVRKLDELLLDSGGHTLLERRFLQLMRAVRPTLGRRRRSSIAGATGGKHARVDFIFEEHYDRRGGVGEQGPLVRRRTGKGRPTAQRAAGRWPARVRVTYQPVARAIRATSSAQCAEACLGHEISTPASGDFVTKAGQ